MYVHIVKLKYLARSVFGGTVGPNPQKSTSGAAGNDQQYYEGIKVRLHPLIINIQQHSATATATNKQTAAAVNASAANRSRKPTAITNVQPIKSPPLVPQSKVSPNAAIAITATTATAAPVMTATNTESNSSDNSSSNNVSINNSSGAGGGSGTAVVTTANSPASPILKAQLSAPPKQRDISPVASCNKGDVKSQVIYR